MNLTELWMLKESIGSGVAQIIDGPEKVFGKEGKYYTIYAVGDQAYTLLSHGIHGGGSGISDEWSCVTRVNKISIERVHQIRSWQYD